MSGYCAKHKRAEQQDFDKHRGTAAQRGYGAKWRKARLGFLAKHPLCEDCLEDGKVTAATEVHHTERHGGDMRIFWDSSKWRSLCKAHHSARTAQETGWGRTHE